MDAHINAFGGTHSAPKKRVLFVVTQSEMGGAQQFIFQFIKHIEKDSYDISVAVGSDGDGSLSRALIELGIPVFILSALKRGINPISDLRSIGQIKKLIQKIKPETIFLGSSKAGFVGAWAAQSCFPRPKVIYRIGGWSFNDPSPTWQRKLWQILEKISAPWKDIIIVNNTHDLTQAKEMGIKPREGVVLVHNGLDPYKIGFLTREEARVQLVLPHSKKVIGIIANFYPAKGLEYAIEAASKIDRDDVVWCVIGDGMGRFTLKRMIEDAGLVEKVLLVGRKEDASQYLHAFDLFVLPSVKEGFPWVILEAMAAKLPIIASRVGAVPEIIEDGISGYVVEPRDSDQIAERVATLLDNTHKAQEMGIQAHQRLLFAFNIETTIHQIEKLL